jgi:tocopherol O-methyltransferase
MIACPSVSKRSIRNHYDLATPFYRLLWGRHIHHGLWEDGGATPEQAQQRLIERLAGAARIAPDERVLDVGCGMGGSSIELVRRYGCRVTGLTLSPLQRWWAVAASVWQGVGRRTRFRCADAETVELPDAAFDVVWNVECSEHFFDKPAFFRRVARWLKPGGRLALCAWLAGMTADAEPHVRAVCEAFLCPSLGTADDYLGWFRAAGLAGGRWADLTHQVEQTWHICQQRIQASGVQRLGRLFGRNMQAFLDHFGTLREAYHRRAMQYGMFVAEKALC